MLSIEKMDFDSDVEIFEEGVKMEVIDIDEDSNEDKKDENILNSIVHDLELVPIVYTTKIDDILVDRTWLPLVDIHPNEATAWIMKKSKPVLSTIPGPPKKCQKNINRFKKLQETLQRIYCSNEEVVVKKEIETAPTTCDIKIDFNSVKSEVIDELAFELKSDLRKQFLKTEKPKETCKYSDLLKQCKPCSVVLTKVVGNRTGQVIHGGQLLKANKVHKPGVVSSSLSLSSDDDVPLITFPPDLLIETNSSSKEVKSMQPKNIESNNLVPRRKRTLKNSDIVQRLLRNGILEITDSFSDDHFFYITDVEGNLLEYFKNIPGSLPYDSTRKYEYKYRVNNCCWVKRDEFIQSLYPKILVYGNTRFIRKPHPCKPGACTCCCRKKEIYKKPELPLTVLEPIKKTVEVDVVRDLETEIDVNIINRNKTPKFRSKELLRDLLTSPRGNQPTLIQKALNYKKLQPVKQTDNRRLVTLTEGDSQNSVIVFRNFSTDETEIYEINAEGDAEVSFKTIYYSNSSQPDVKKLLKKTNVTIEAVCCWYKREEVISKLLTCKTLHPKSVKFLRISHSCQSQKCKCCCKPAKNRLIRLEKIAPPARTLLSTSTLKAFTPSKFVVFPQDDDDCRITSIMSSPTLLPSPSHIPQRKVVSRPLRPGTLVPVTSIPATVKPATGMPPTVTRTTAIPATVTPASVVPPTEVTPSLFVTDAIDGEELSKEVNSLITSILDRFKDVRLTINGDGKVAAALNTPVNTLSTVELKVLANILSFAQSQVNMLGSKVKSGSTLSLSNIINLKVDDVQSNATIDPNTVYKEFGKNVNLSNSQNDCMQQTNVNDNSPLVIPLLPESATVAQAHSNFTGSMYVQKQKFNDAFSSFINTKVENNAQTVIPVIENVFSLKETENTEDDLSHTSSTTVWYRKPAAQSSEPSHSDASTNTSVKRNKLPEGNLETGNLKRIRIRSPTKLGPTITDNSQNNKKASNIPNTPLQHTATEEGTWPEDYVLPNSGVVFPALGKPQMVNSVAPQSTQPVLVINPLNNSGGVLVRDTMSTPDGSTNAASTSQSQLVNTESNNYITVEHDANQEDTTVAGEVIEKQEPLDDADMVCVFEDDVSLGDQEDEETMDFKCYPEDNEEEGDCILGF